MASNPEKEIRIRTEKSPGFRFIHVSGAYGGITPQGELVCNLFVEHHYPQELRMVIDKDGNAVEHFSQQPGDPNWIRSLEAALVMRPEVALSIGRWLIFHAESLKPPANPS